MRTLRFFVPVVWTLTIIYLIACFMDLMNTNSTSDSYVGIIGVISIIYTSYTLKLGLEIINKLTKKKKQ